ncbi:MAG: PKD domain-containing protein, partial [Thermoplasmata archaeon]|nr:PKD domain-containing protein [Thermoplasmata archaeon]
YRTNSILIYTNATDSETASNLIDAELHYKPSIWGDEELNWTNLTTRSYNAIEARWEFNFTADAYWLTGYYSFRLRFIDADEGVSSWYKYKKAVNVKNNAPNIVNVSVAEENITRVDKLTIFIEANDIEDTNKLNLKIQYRYALQEGTYWNVIDSGNISNPTGKNTQWEAYIQLNTSVKLGYYDLNVEITDLDNKMVSSGLDDFFNVINIGPEMDSITLSATEVYRTNSIFIYVDAEDTEDSGEDLKSELQYSSLTSPQEEDWLELYIADIHWEPSSGVIRARFHPTPSAGLGTYKIRARVGDQDGAWSDWQFADESIEVKNNLPNIVMEDIPNTVNEDENISFDTSKSSDIESKLLYYFWDFDDGSPLSAQKQTAHTYTESGIYNLTLSVEDPDGGSSTINRTIVVLNVEPVADGYSNIQSAFVGQEVTFHADNSYDTPSDTNDLTYQWDFDDGPPLEEGKTVTHTFNTATRYFITLTVIDSDGDEHEDTIMLVINEPSDSDGNDSTSSDKGFDLLTMGSIIIVIVIILALVILLLWFRRKQAADKKLADAVAPKLPKEFDEPDVIIRPGTVAPSRTTPELEVTPTPTLAAPAAAPDGFEQLEGVPPDTPRLPAATGLGTLPSEHPKRPAKKAEPEVIAPDIVFAPEIPAQQEPLVKGAGATKGASPEPTEVLIPEELSPTTPLGQVPEEPSKPEPSKVKKRVPKVKKK